MQDSVKQDRDRYLGGSDIPIIMNLSPFKSRFDLLLEKAGYKENDFKGNVYTEYGNTMEPKIREAINAEIEDTFVEGKHVREAEADEINGVRIHTDGETDDTILAVYDRPEDLSEEFESDRLQVFNVRLKDYKELCSEISDACERFIEDLAKVKDNPFITEEELLPTDITEITRRILAFEDQIKYMKSVEAQIKSEKARLKDAMQASGVKSWTTPNGYKITLVPDGEDSTKKVLDEDKLKKEDPDTYNKYLKDKIVKGRSGYVLITEPKSKEA